MSRIPAIVALVASAFGAVFSGISTYDYTKHLDRQLHVVHCSFVPGLASADAADNACRAAMNSSYGAVFRGMWWGGVPVSLLGLGVYLFFVAFALSLVVGGIRASRKAYFFFGWASLIPLLASVVMAYIAAVKLGVFCKTCVGMYGSSMLLAIGGIWGMVRLRHLSVGWVKVQGLDGVVTHEPGQAMPVGKTWAILLWLGAMALCVGIPVAVYVQSLPDYRPVLASCGTIQRPKNVALLSITTWRPRREAILVTDPLCPTCKGLHERLVAEGVLENLLPMLALMPLDSACNWMLDRALHPGSCLLSKLVICSQPKVRETLEWIYQNQELLATLGKSDETILRERLRTHFGPSVDTCLDAKQTELRLNNMLQYAVENGLSVSTPQFYLGNRRICDEDTDLGLRYTLTQIAPEVLQ